MKHKIQFLQFYISNTCNLACPNCVSFNNLAFKGHFKFDKNNVQAWANIIDAHEVAIIGGEPFSNPWLKDWVEGLQIFTCEDFRISTNGTYIKQYEQQVLDWISQGVNVDISCHSPQVYNELWDWVHLHFKNLIQTEHEPEYNHVTHRFSNGQGWVQLRNAYHFVPNAVKEIKDGIIYMHNNDPETAHSSCGWSDCHYIVDGRLYKCCVTAAGPQLLKQFQLDEQSKILLEQTQSVSPFDPINTVDKFISNIENYCNQCALCPVNPTNNLFTFDLPVKKERVC